ncbi:hypothetical protein Celaphus_00000464 [Cervus elaphus hippelaphus]|uniref:UDENN FNIP1/2-type domain-containing protein n=1 Tax=Cervus elaphus hippelaphus TaxID=46360 RepID=A0A212DAM7_CEREH|nr:hypothetical protein Celaphus_00000464 [Cervus elaphus hippelaphus]
MVWAGTYPMEPLCRSSLVSWRCQACSELSLSNLLLAASLSSLLITPFPSPSSSTSSSSSYQRRWLRSQTTSLENGIIPRRSMDETFSLAEETCSSNPAIVRRKKIAISIIFSLCEKEEAQRNFQDFFFSHFPLFESHMNRLKSAIEKVLKVQGLAPWSCKGGGLSWVTFPGRVDWRSSGRQICRHTDVSQQLLIALGEGTAASHKAMISCRKIAESSLRVQFYVSRLMEALGEFRGTIWSLYSVPRIAEPVWLAMMSSTLERTQLCQRFLREFTLLIEQINKNQFFAALLTAVLTYHLAWVPTVMPVDHPPIKAFSEKRTSQLVNMLAKTHPYNPLWAQLGDLYGAIGSPVRLTRTVVLGKQKDLVQRILYVLTYFVRCSELQENQLMWSGGPAQGEQILHGSSITTALERGEVEESEYVVVTVRSEPALLPPTLPVTTAEGLAGVPVDADPRDLCPQLDGEGGGALEKSLAAHGARRPQGASCGEEESKESPRGGSARLPSGAGVGTGLKMSPPAIGAEPGGEVPKKLPDRSAARPCPDGRLRDRPPWEKVTFHIGSSVSPESDFESRTKAMEERLQACRCAEPEPAQRPPAGPGAAADPAQESRDQRALTCSGSPGASGGARDVRTEAAAEVAGAPGARAACAPANPAGAPARPGGLGGKDADAPAMSGCTAPVPGGDASFRVEGGLPRNESSDSALGDSDDDACAAASPDLGPGSDPDADHDQSEGSLEVELPLPR